MRSIAILDAGPLVAAADASDPHHDGAARILRRVDLDLVIPALVIAEATYLISTWVGPRQEAEFLRRLDRFAIEPPADQDWPVIAALVERYADFPLGTSDAATIVLADRLGTDLMVTLDRRHFSAVESPQGRHFRLLPESIAVHEEPARYDARSSWPPSVVASLGTVPGWPAPNRLRRTAQLLRQSLRDTAPARQARAHLPRHRRHRRV